MIVAPTISAPVLARARSDQVAQLYTGWHRTTVSMLLGATLLCTVLWGTVSPWFMAAWMALIVVNQAWRGLLARSWRQRRPGADATARWGRYWAVGSTIAGMLWGLAAIAMFPESPDYQALLIVCLFGVVLAGLNLTAVYKPSFYGFVLPALVPLVIRVASEGDQVHLYTALVMTMVLGFVLAFGHYVNGMLTQSLAIRYENLDLIGELKDHARIAQEARLAAERANRGKSELLVAASHDLRQPLHALGLYAAALATRARGSPWQPLVAQVQNAVETLEAQFAQLIDLSRLESGNLTASVDRVPLAPLFARVVAPYAISAAANGVALRVRSTVHAVSSDPVLLERVLANLVSNAIRYTRRGGVLICARRLGADVAIDVVDTGPGIDPAHRQRIFDEFYRVGNSAAGATAQGTGLGLAIVRRIAKLLRHPLELRSTPGTGSRFRIRAPRLPDESRVTPFDQPAPTNATAGSGTQLAGRLVAVIDDDPRVVNAMGELFATWGAAVAGGGDADIVLDRLGDVARYPDLIVADLRLANGGCGITSVQRLREELGLPIPSLIVSGDTSVGAEQAVRAAGLPLLRKPVLPTVLAAVAAALIAGSGPEHGTKPFVWTQ